LNCDDFSIDSYREYVQATIQNLKQSSVEQHAAIVSSVYVNELKNSFLSQKRFEQLNKELYLTLKEIAIYPLLLSERIPVEALKLASAVIRNNFRVPKSQHDRPVLKNLTDKFNSIKSEDFHAQKTNNALFLFVAEAFKGDGSDARVDLLERLVDLNVNTFQQSEAHFKVFSTLLRDIIDRHLAIEVLKNSVFKGKFWNKDIRVKKSNFLWVVPTLWNIYGSENEFKALYPVWVDIFKKAIQKNMTELAFFMHFHLSHVYLNLAHTQNEFKQFNDDVEKIFSDYIKNKVLAEYNILPVTRKCPAKPRKVAFVYDRLVNNSPTKLLYSWLELLTKENPDTDYYIYDIEYVEKSYSDKKYIDLMTSLGVKYHSAHKAIDDLDEYSYYSHLNKSLKLREQIISDEIDELIMCNNREQFNFLFASCTAPIQTYWCHGNFEYDICGINRRITHIKGMQENDIPYERFDLKQSEIFFEEESQKAEVTIDIIRKRFAEGSVILGSIGRLIKIEGEQYLETVAEIMKKHPNTVYLACGSGGKDNILKKVQSLDIADRFFFEGHVEPLTYSQVIDVYLNTFPNPSGESANEYLKLNNGTGLVSLNNTIETYKWVASEQIELCTTYGHDAVRDMYIYNGKSKSLNENSSALKDLREKADHLRNYYLDGTILIGIIGDIEHADQTLRNFLVSLDNVAFLYTYEENKAFFSTHAQKSHFVHINQIVSFAAHMNINIKSYIESPEITLLKLIQQCCIPSLLPKAFGLLEKFNVNSEKASIYTDELCLSYILAGQYENLNLLSNLYTEPSSTNIVRLFLYNYFKNISSPQEALPKDFMTITNITYKSLHPLFKMLFRYKVRHLTDAKDIYTIEVLTSMLLAEYSADNLDNFGVDILLRALSYTGKVKELDNILTKEININRFKQEHYILFATILVLYGDIKEATSLLGKSDVDLAKEYTSMELLQISLLKIFEKEFETAHKYLGKLHNQDKYFFKSTSTPPAFLLIALIYKGLNCVIGDDIWAKQAKKNIFYENHKHLWSIIPISNISLTPYHFDGIDDINIS
jgi:hypothetical protein